MDKHIQLNNSVSAIYLLLENIADELLYPFRLWIIQTCSKGHGVQDKDYSLSLKEIMSSQNKNDMVFLLSVIKRSKVYLLLALALALVKILIKSAIVLTWKLVFLK